MDSHNQIQRAHILTELEHVPEALRAQWKAAFYAFDHNQNGLIDANELSQVMASMKMIPAHGEVEAMIAAVDHNMDNMVDFQEFEMMMASAGRGRPGTPIGFSHVVERQIRMTEVAALMAKECRAFMDHFCRQHAGKFMDLPASGQPLHSSLQQATPSPAWFDTHKQFQEELELMVQNLLMLWGVAAQQHFQEDFIDAALRTDLGAVLQCTNYNAFLTQMSAVVAQVNTGMATTNGHGCVPHETPKRMHSKAVSRLSEVDAELAALDKRRNELLAERRRLIGCDIENVTVTALTRELQNRQYREDVGMD